MRRRRQRIAEVYLPIFGTILYAAGIVFAVVGGGNSPVSAGLRSVSIVIFCGWAIRRRALPVWIFWSMLAGVEIGLDAPGLASHLHIFSELFLRLIETIVAPLILGTLITGIAAHGDSRAVSRLAIKSFLYFEILTTVALVIGLVAINISKAGVGARISAPDLTSMATGSAPAPSALPFSWEQFLLHVVPENLAASIAGNQILQVAVFAVLFGLALGSLNEEKKFPLLDVLESFTATMFRFTNLVMNFAPLGVGSAIAYTVAHSGYGVMLNLGKLVLTLYAAIAAFLVIGLLPCALLARVPLRRFLAAVAEPATIAFATSTSEAALPRAMERMEELGVPNKIVGFVIPTGYSFNLAGSALYLSLAALFMAQSAGIQMNWGRQFAMMATLMLTSKGVAGIPRAVLVVLMATAASFHLPLDMIATLLGVDALMDMGRTSVNVVGNCLASVVIAQWEGEFFLSPEPVD